MPFLRIHIALFMLCFCLAADAQVLRYTTAEKEQETVLTSVTVTHDHTTRIYDAAKLVTGTVVHYRSGGGVNLIAGAGIAALTAERRQELLDGRLTCGLPNPGGAAAPLTTSPTTSGRDSTPGIALIFAEPVLNRAGIDVVLFELQKGGPDPFHVAPFPLANGLKGVTIRTYDLQASHPAALEVGPTNLFRCVKPPRTLAALTTAELQQHSSNEGGFTAAAVGIDLSDLGYAPDQAAAGLFLQSVAGKSSFDPVAVLGLPARVPENLLAREPVAQVFQPEQTEMLAAALHGDGNAFEEIIFAQRVSGRDHWYGNFGHYCETESPYSRAALTVDGDMRYAFAAGGRLCRYNLRTGELRVLLDDPEGGIRDPHVHYDGRKVLFSYRRGAGKTFHLYEIGVDGGDLTQLTDGPDNDIEPVYTPDGGIVFCSSRCHRYVPCWRTQVATLYRCDADGGNVRMLSNNAEQENTPWMLPDGRVLYMRWEYVDRNQLLYHHLWTVNPDGAGVMVYFGNQHRGYAMLDAKPIPGTQNVVASFSPGHGRAEHMGYVTIVDPRNGPDDMRRARRVGKRAFRDPYPVTSRHFLVADARGIHVLDDQGREQLAFKPARPGRRWACHEPRPLRSRPREPVVTDRVQLDRNTGQLVLSDVYRGRNMEGVKRGDITQLLVLEQLPKPANFSGGQEPLTIGGTFTLERILGTVPVESDGSASFEVPALKSVFFVALDARDRAVKRMHSFVTVQPGETTGCVGCHEERVRAPHPRTRPRILALERQPSKITPMPDIPDVLDFPRDVQPILDRHCVRCHNAHKRPKGVDLSGDRTPFYTNSYWTMFTHGLVRDGRNGYGNAAPRSTGSAASPLLDILESGHRGRVKASEREKTIARLWIDSGAPYPGTYGALGSGMAPVKFPKDTMRRRCASCHTATERSYRNVKKGAFYYQFGPRKPPQPLLDSAQDIILLRHLAYFRLGESRLYQALCNLDHPEKSLLLLAPLAKEAGGLQLCGNSVFENTDDPDYREILGTIREAAAELQQTKRFDMPDFRPNRFYIREMQNYGVLPVDLAPNTPLDVYATDQAYWQTFEYRVEPAR